MDNRELFLFAYGLIGLVFSIYIFGWGLVLALLHIVLWPIFAALTSMGILHINSDCEFKE